MLISAVEHSFPRPPRTSGRRFTGSHELIVRARHAHSLDRCCENVASCYLFFIARLLYLGFNERWPISWCRRIDLFDFPSIEAALPSGECDESSASD